MVVGSNTSDIVMANLVMLAADGSGRVWQDSVQLLPHGMNNDPAGFVANLKAGLPLVNTLRVLFNEYSFNADGSMHPHMEAFLARAVAAGYKLDICYGGGDAQNIGIGKWDWPSLTNAQAMTALQANYGDMAGAWSKMMDWMDGHANVKAGVYGWELMNESAGYRHSIRANGAGNGLTAADFVKLYVNHANGLADLIANRADGKILVGGWGYNGDFLTLNNTQIAGQSAIDALRAGVGADLVWSAHLYPGWMETDAATSPAALIDRLEEIYAPIRGDDVLITEINADGRVDDPAGAANYEDFYAASYDWFAANGIGLGWYPAVQTGASHLMTIEWNGKLAYRHQHSLAHALNGFSMGQSPASAVGHQVVAAKLQQVRLRNEAYEVAAGEAQFDSASHAGFGFGYAGNDTVKGTDGSNDFLYGGSGNDLIRGLGSDDFLFGQAGDDTILGGRAIDNLFGGAGADLLDGGAGRDFMVGGKQDDSYVVDHAADTVRELAREGIDTVMTSLASYTLGNHVEKLIYTGAGRFAGTGNALDNTLTGRGFAETLSGAAGDDHLIGGRGADRLNGGAGRDTASYETASAGVTADLSKVTSAASAGDARGDIFISIESLAGSAYADRLSGNGAGNTLSGQSGADILQGRGGADLLVGGAGADRLVFARNWDADRVVDFQDNLDTIVLQGLPGVRTLSQALDHARNVAGDVRFDFGAGDTLLIENTTVAALTNDLLILG